MTRMSHETPLPAYLKEAAGGALLAVKLTPRASRNQIAEALGGELRIRVTAPPVDAAANAALVELLADRLGCSRGCVELVRGHTARHKLLKLHGITARAASQTLRAAT